VYHEPSSALVSLQDLPPSDTGQSVNPFIHPSSKNGKKEKLKGVLLMSETQGGRRYHWKEPASLVVLLLLLLPSLLPYL